MRQKASPLFSRTDRRRARPAISAIQATDADQAVAGERRGGDRRQLNLNTLTRLFQDVPEHALIDALQNCVVVEYAEQTVLLQPGTVNRSIYMLLAGQMTLDLGTEEAPHPIAVERGQSVGEMSIADGSSVSARVTAEPGCRILIIDEDTFWQQLMVLPGVARNMLTIQAERIRRSNDLFIEKLRGEMVFAQLKNDLSMAAEIQLNMLPRVFPLYPDRSEFDIYATMVPARAVGGDFYDAFMIDRDHLFFIVGDVSGKGVAAALFMTRAMTLFRVEASRHLPPHRILEMVNGQMAANNERCMFVTVICGLLDVRTGAVTYSNAGHCPPLIGSGEGFRYIAIPEGAAIGLIEGCAFASAEIQLLPGEIFFLYTDGVTEAVDEADQEFSEGRLAKDLSQIGTNAARHVVTQLCESVTAFTNGAPQSDDITVLAVRYLGTAQSESVITQR